MFRRCLLCLCLIFPVSLHADEKKEPAFVAEFKKLQAEIEAEAQKINAEFTKPFEAAKTPAEFDAVRKDYSKRYDDVVGKLMQKLLTLVQPHAADTTAVEPLAWWLERNPGSSDAIAVAGLLVRHHVTHPRVAEAAARQRLAPWSETIFRAVLEADVPKDTKATATFRLAQWLARRADFLTGEAALVATDPDYKPDAGAAALLKELKNRDAAKMEKEAVQRFQEVVDKFPDAKDRRGNLLADQAKTNLHAIATLRLGKVAPDIDAEDLDGKRFKLSESRGRVVVLVFWATWCGPCMAAVPHERELVTRMKDRPFALIGVNGDEKREAATKAVTANKINWRSFWNGGPSGAITTAWNVTTMPMVYVLDAKGVIRAKDIAGPTLDNQVERLIKQLEAEKK